MSGFKKPVSIRYDSAALEPGPLARHRLAMKTNYVLAVTVALLNAAAGFAYAGAVASDPAGAGDPDVVPYTATGSTSAAFTAALGVDPCNPVTVCLEVPPGWSIETRPRED